MTFFFTSLFVLLVFWRPQEWLVEALDGWPILDAVTVMALLALLVEHNERRLHVPVEMPQVYLLVGLWGAALMSHVAHTYFDGLMDTWFPVFKICLFCFLLLCVLDRPSRLRWMAILFVAMSALMAVHAMMQHRIGHGFGGQRPLFIAGYDGRGAHYRSLFFGIFEDPNDLGQILATSVPLAFALPRRRSIFGWVIAALLAALLLYGVKLTHSRGGYLAAAIALGMMFALVLPSRWLPALMIVMVVAGLLLCPISGAFLDESAHDRVSFWGDANRAFKGSPLFGVGYGMLGEYISEGRASHNALVSCYTEIGLFGYWFWFCLLYLGVIGAWRTRVLFNRPENPDQEYLRRFAGLGLAAMAAFVASSYFLTRAFVYPMFFLFAMLGVLPFVAARHAGRTIDPLIDTRRDVYLMGTVGALGSVIYVYWSILLLNQAWFGG